MFSFTDNLLATKGDTTLQIHNIEILDSNSTLIDIIDKISCYEKSVFGCNDTLLYGILLTKTSINRLKMMDSLNSVYLTGLDNYWPLPDTSLNNIIGFVKRDNIYFIIYHGGGFTHNYWYQVFHINSKSEAFTLSPYKSDANIIDDDDSVIRLWCHFFYKDGHFYIKENSCYDNEKILNLD